MTSEPARRPSRSSACAASLRPTAVLFGATEIEGGFPHSEISGSKPVRGSPKLIAAYHVLHRLSAPRHPPDTLMALDCSHRQSAFSTCLRLGVGDKPHSGAKRPVLLQTHPEIPAVKPGSRLVLEGSDFRDETRPSRHGLTASTSTGLAPSGPRPNALPLHNVRYRKVSKPKPARTPLEHRSQKRRPTARRRSKRSLKERTDKFHRNGSGSCSPLAVGSRL